MELKSNVRLWYEERREDESIGFFRAKEAAKGILTCRCLRSFGVNDSTYREKRYVEERREYYRRGIRTDGSEVADKVMSLSYSINRVVEGSNPKEDKVEKETETLLC